MKPIKPKAKKGFDQQWTDVPENIREAIKSGWANGMPPLASAIHVRWWQLESWLRSLLYVELRASNEAAWVDALPKLSETRQQGESEFRYMATPDAQNQLAYADASALFKITLENWQLFEPSLLSKGVWTGRIEELLAIRNRMGHCRRPHFDDLARLEQTLRDLNGGAFVATSAFNKQWSAERTWTDLVVDGWLRGQHETASRLIKHAERQYDTLFELRYSRRPWAAPKDKSESIVGKPGYIWHAFWYFRGGRDFRLDRFWKDIECYRDLVFLVCADNSSSISVSFSALADTAAISDAIGHCFDAALCSIAHGQTVSDYGAWQAKYAEIDPRVHVMSPWTLVEEEMKGISIFGA